MGAHLNTVLVDANNIGFAALLGSKTRLMAGPIETTGVYGFLQTMRVVRRDFAGPIIILWDGRSWRHEAALQQAIVYKGGREATPEQIENRERWKQSRLRLPPLLRALGLSQMVCSNLEADDLAARLRRTMKAPSITLVSSDHDWLGLIDERTSVYDHVKERITNLGNFEANTGYKTPRAIVEAKGLSGDKSDNLPGVGGIGDKTVKEILAYGSVRAFLNTMLTEPERRGEVSGRALKLLDDMDKQARFERNLELIDLDHPKAPAPINPTQIKGAFDEPRFRNACDELAFFSITRSFDTWTAPFRASA